VEFSKVNYVVDGPIATISLNSPKNMNAFDEIMIDDVVAALKCAEQDAAVRTIMLNSTGKSFSAGGDLGAIYQGIESGTMDFGGVIEKMADVSLTIKRLCKPVIAVVSGAVAGAAFNVVLACDFCIAAEDTQFIQAFVNIALIPDGGGFYLMTRALGVNKATELAMSGRPVDAREAKALGFVAQVCAPDELQETAAKLAKRLVAGPAECFAAMKRLIMESEFSGFEAYIKKEVKAQVACADTQNFKEGISAFVQKRKPKFQ